MDGPRDEITEGVIKFLKELGINTVGNADFIKIKLDSFTVEDARNLKSYAADRSFSTLPKIFIISTNNFLLEAQNSLLKMFEEPIQNTFFFLIVPDAKSLLKTFASRFFAISLRSSYETNFATELKEAEKFVAMPLEKRFGFIKELLPKKDDETEAEMAENLSKDSNRSIALKFLNALEATVHQNMISTSNPNIRFIEHFFKVREFLRQPGSSTKTLMESVAVATPELSD
jgi:DNA polymerase-3 subunit delta'